MEKKMLDVFKKRLEELESAREQTVMNYNKVIGAIEETKMHIKLFMEQQLDEQEDSCSSECDNAEGQQENECEQS